MAYDLLGKNFVPPDVHGKVTGKAKYAEDFRAEGMVFCRLLTSPMPHARVRSVDAGEALKLPGVLGILTADEVPAQPPPSDPILTNEPMFVGQPILAVAAVDEQTAQDAIDLIKIDYEELPFCVDPLVSLYPGGADARLDGNVIDNRLTGPPQLKSAKWSAGDFARAAEGQLPTGEPVLEWSYGDIDAGFAQAKVIIDESFVTAGMSHHSMEPRSAMAYWENGKCFLYGSTQSQSFVVPGLAGYLGISPADLVYVAETCGGGFGSKGAAYPIMAVPAYMAKKINRPVMMRISRAEEYFLGFARTGFQGRIRMGFDATGRVTAADLYIVQENGPTTGFPDWPSSGETVSILYQPPAMRFRGIAVMTNTPPRSAQRGPGHNQTVAAVEPLIDKAARQLGIDRYEIRRINGPKQGAVVGENRAPVTSCYLEEARDKAAMLFNYEQKKALSGQRNGSKVTGIGIGQAFHPAGFAGFDGLVRITPDGKTHIHTGVGNLGTYSHTGTSRVAAEVLKANWDNCIVERGDTRKGLPWNIGQFGSNTSFTMARTNFAAATDAVAKLKQIAAMDLGGSPDGLRHRRREGVRESRCVEEPDVRASRGARDSARRQVRRPREPDRHQSDDGGCRNCPRGNRLDRRREGQSSDHGAARRVRRELHADRARPGDRPLRDHRLRRGRRLRHRDPSSRLGHADQGRRRDGLRLGRSRTAHLRSAERPAWQRGLVSSETGNLSRRAVDDDDRRGGSARSAEPARHEGHR